MSPGIPAVPPDPVAPLDANAGTGGVSRARHAKPGYDRPRIWLPVAAAGLCVLAGAAAVVSFSAQYRLVYAARHLAAVAALEASIPDAAALVFACLGVALAMHGRRAVWARVLNVASAGASVFMNVIAAAPGWRDLAVWAMPPAAYALASDTLIGVVRTGAVARHQAAGLADGDVSVLAVAGGLVLWMLRLAMAPASTLTGFRTWVVAECPVAPGRRGARPAPPVPAGGPVRAAAVSRRGSGSRGGTKTARFLALVTERHGPLAAIPLGSVGQICAAVAPQAGLNAGSARAALRRAVLAAQDGDRR